MHTHTHLQLGNIPLERTHTRTPTCSPEFSVTTSQPARYTFMASIRRNVSNSIYLCWWCMCVCWMQETHTYTHMIPRWKKTQIKSSQAGKDTCDICAREFPNLIGHFSSCFVLNHARDRDEAKEKICDSRRYFSEGSWVRELHTIWIFAQRDFSAFFSAVLNWARRGRAHTSNRSMLPNSKAQNIERFVDV